MGEKKEWEQLKLIKTSFHTYKYIFTDFDDTIIYTSYANFLAYKNAVHEILNIDIAFIDERFTHNTLSQLEKDNNIIDKIINLKNHCYSKYLQYTYPNNNLLDILKNHNNKIIVVTNGNKNRIENTLKYHNLQNQFHKRFYITPSSQSLSKYLEVFNQLNENNIKMEEIFIFENSELEILKALNCGFKMDNILKISPKIYRSTL